MIKLIAQNGFGKFEEIPFNLGKFPCGETNLTVTLMSDYFGYQIYFNYESDQDLIHLMLLTDALNKAGVPSSIMSLHIGYFPYGRQDRVCNPGEPHSLKVVCNLINGLGYQKVYVIDPHSDVIEALLDNPHIVTMSDVIRDSGSTCMEIAMHTDQFVSPDAGAYKKVNKVAQTFNLPVVRADKIRDTQTGNISGIEVYNEDLTGQCVMILDDICDGGGTFIGLAKKLREKGAERIVLYVSHGMFTKGVDILLENGIDEIICYEYYGKSEQDREKINIIGGM